MSSLSTTWKMSGWCEISKKRRTQSSKASSRKALPADAISSWIPCIKCYGLGHFSWVRLRYATLPRRALYTTTPVTIHKAASTLQSSSCTIDLFASARVMLKNCVIAGTSKECIVVADANCNFVCEQLYGYFSDLAPKSGSLVCSNLTTKRSGDLTTLKVD